MSKIKSYLGFCQKAGDLVIGYNNLEKTKKGVFLIMVDISLGENTLKKVKKFAEHFKCDLCKAEYLKLYHYDGIEICEECLLKQFEVVEGSDEW